jgi:hypothetical protein
MMPIGSARTALVVAHFKAFCVRPSTSTCETRDEARIARSSVAASVTPVPSEFVIGMLRITDSSWI